MTFIQIIRRVVRQFEEFTRIVPKFNLLPFLYQRIHRFLPGQLAVTLFQIGICVIRFVEVAGKKNFAGDIFIALEIAKKYLEFKDDTPSLSREGE